MSRSGKNGANTGQQARLGHPKAVLDIFAAIFRHAGLLHQAFGTSSMTYKLSSALLDSGAFVASAACLSAALQW